MLVLVAKLGFSSIAIAIANEIKIFLAGFQFNLIQLQYLNLAHFKSIKDF